MPKLEVKRILTFTDEEKELINKVIKLIESIDTDFCDTARCGDCPFDSLCSHSNNADRVEQQMNEIIND